MFTQIKKANRYAPKKSKADVHTHTCMASQEIRDVCMAMGSLLADTQMVKQAFDEKR